MSKEIFIKMREEEYALIPSEIKERFFNSKNVTIQNNDWAENMKDDVFAKLYEKKKSIQKQLSEREYQLREKRRKNDT